MSETLVLTMQDESPAEAQRGRAFDALAAVARRKLGAGPSWEAYGWRVLAGGDVLVEGAVPSNPTAKAGPRRWKGCKGDMVVVTRAESDAAVAEYERTTGLCARCTGSKETWTGWSRGAGHLFKPCPKCSATGKAAVDAAPAPFTPREP